MKKIIVIVPAYCEENSIAETIIALKKIKPQINDLGFDYQICIVNDGSTDKTVERAIAAGVDNIVHHHVNQGLGSAVRTGLQTARRNGADIAVKFDADLQHDPMDILAIIQPIINDTAEIVYGNRFEKIQYKMPFVRRTGNLIFTKLMRWLTNWPVVDSQPGIFAVSKDYLKVSYIPGDYNYTQQILLDAFHKGMRFAQVPVTFNKRNTGNSFVSWRYPFLVITQILQVLVGVKPLKIFAPFGLLCILLSFLVGTHNVYTWLSGNATKPIQQVNLVMGLGLFGFQTLFLGLLADLIVKINGNSPHKK